MDTSLTRYVIFQKQISIDGAADGFNIYVHYLRITDGQPLQSDRGKQIKSSLEGWDPVNRFNHASWVAIITPTDRPKSVRNRFVIEDFGGGFMLSRCFLDCSVDVGAFVIGPSQIFFFFFLVIPPH